MGGRVARNLQGRLQVTLVARVSVNPAKEGRTEKICIVDPHPEGGQGIAQGGTGIFVDPIQFIQDIVPGADCHGEVSRFPILLVCIQQGIGNKRGADEIRGPGRNDNRPRLPWKAVTPAPVCSVL